MKIFYQRLIFTVAVFFLCNSLAFAGLHGTSWCDDTDEYCHGFYLGTVYIKSYDEDSYTGGIFSYIDLNPYYFSWTNPITLLFGAFYFNYGNYSRSTGTLHYSGIGFTPSGPISGRRTLSLATTNWSPYF